MLQLSDGSESERHLPKLCQTSFELIQVIANLNPTSHFIQRFQPATSLFEDSGTVTLIMPSALLFSCGSVLSQQISLFIVRALPTSQAAPLWVFLIIISLCVSRLNQL
jgi:hypothetical protein